MVGRIPVMSSRLRGNTASKPVFSTESKVPTWNPMLVPTEGLGAAAGTKGKPPGQEYGTYYWTGLDRKARENLDGDDSRIIMDRVVPFVESAIKDNQPFFAVVWFHTPHLPTIAGGKYLDMYRDQPLKKRHYYGAITAMDEQIGRLRELLKGRGVEENTLIWFASDNGPERGTPGTAGPLRGRKRSLYEGGIRVPGLVVWPKGFPARRVVSVPCVTSDYLPTILQAVGLGNTQGPLPIDGVDLMPILQGTVNERSNPIGFQHAGQSCWIDNGYKLYRKSPKNKVELYDLLDDIGEQHDISTSHPNIVARLQSQLESWQASCQRSSQGHDYE